MPANQAAILIRDVLCARHDDCGAHNDICDQDEPFSEFDNNIVLTSDVLGCIAVIPFVPCDSLDKPPQQCLSRGAR